MKDKNTILIYLNQIRNNKWIKIINLLYHVCPNIYISIIISLRYAFINLSL